MRKSPDIVPAMTEDERARTESVLAVEVAKLRRAVEESEPANRRRTRQIVTEVSLALLIAGVTALAGFIWSMNARVETMLDRQIRIERDRIEANDAHSRLDDRLRVLERGR